MIKNHSVNISLNKIILIVSLIISGLILIISEEMDVFAHVISFFIPVITGVFLVKLDMLHPYVWYTTFFSIYSCAYPVLYLFNYVTKFGYNKETMVYQWIALAISMIILPASSIELKKEKMEFESKNKGIIPIIEKIVLAYIVLVSLLIVSGGYSSKNDIYSSNNFILNIGFMSGYFAILLYCYEICRTFIQENNKYKKIICEFFIVISCLSLITGERDYMFTVILITFIVLSFFEKIKKKSLFIIFPIGIIFLPLSQVFKYFILSGGTSGTFRWNNLLLEFLDGEFISASRNLQILVSGGYENYFSGSTLLNDFIRVFYNTGYSNQTWFNDNFFTYGHTTQYGFSLVGEGFVNGGIVGIIGLFIFVSMLIRFFYSYAMKKFYYTIAYLYMIPIFIYSTRADLANILSPLIKYVILGILIIKISRKVVLKKHN